MDFNPADHPIIFQESEYFSTVSAWVSHFPFAYLLIELTQPRVLVELGSHAGDSYIAFCQTIKKLNLPTRCFAVDTWQGDVQAGFYDANILSGLRAHHDPRYSEFSTLMQMTFDEAVSKFDDGSIDILHIDGLHTYEAVKHDFDTWRPKLSDRAVVLFHDTAPRHFATFGVYRLWDELTAQFPSFEFKHGGGLGAVAVGQNVPPALKSFLDWANARVDIVRALFDSIGRGIASQQMLLRVVEQQLAEYEALRAWRARTGQQPLQGVNVKMAMENPQELARFLALEVKRAVGQAANVMRC